MKCTECGSLDWKTIDTRVDEQRNAVRRRKECLGCGERATTLETIINGLKPGRPGSGIPKPPPKPKKPKVTAKDKLKARVQAMMKAEARRDARVYDDWFSSDNDYLNKY
jgi:hypothetical protein